MFLHLSIKLHKSLVFEYSNLPSHELQRPDFEWAFFPYLHFLQQHPFLFGHIQVAEHGVHAVASGDIIVSIKASKLSKLMPSSQSLNSQLSSFIIIIGD